MALHMPRNRNPNFLIADPVSGLDHMDPDLQLVSAPHLAAALVFLKVYRLVPVQVYHSVLL